MKLHFLGTASGLPTATRFSQTIVLETADGLTMLDVADGASALLMRQGLDHLSIRTIVISHMHADHHSGLVQLLKTMMHLKHSRTVRIVAPSEGIVPIKAYLRACYLIPEWLGFTIEWLSIEQEAVLDEWLDLIAYPNAHLEPVRKRTTLLDMPPPAWNFESYSFAFTCAGKRIVYSGNLRRSALEMRDYASGADLVILEAAHLDLQDLSGACDSLNAGRVLLTHIPPGLDAKTIAWPNDPRIEIMVDGNIVAL